MTSPHAEQLGRARTAAEFAAAIALLETDLNEAIARKAVLAEAEERAVFGDGDLAAARATVDDCNDRIAALERIIDAAGRRHAEAARSEARAGIAALGNEVMAKVALLGERWRAVRRLVEQLRQELFEADALARGVATANGLFDGAGMAELKVNLTAIRRAAMAGSQAAAPARLSRPALQADRVLLSFLGPGGALDPRPALGGPARQGSRADRRGPKGKSAGKPLSERG